MGKITASKVVDGNFGNCVRLTNGIVEALVTLDFGPRVISVSRKGMENMMYQDIEKKPLDPKLEEYDGQFTLYGGHRIWISPEVLPRCYYPDNKPVVYKKIQNGASFAAPVEDKNFIQKTIRITMTEEAPEFYVEHEVKNCGMWDIEFAIWCLTVLDGGGKEVIPMPKREAGLLSNRNISLWDYSEMNDPRVYWGKNYITLKQDKSKKNPFKLGINNEEGWAAYFNKGQVFIKSFEPSPEGFYPDNNCCFETYTNNVMLECESLSEFVLLEPGEEACHGETWEIFEADAAPSDNEKEIDKVMKKYL